MRTGNLALDYSDDAVSIRAALPDAGDAPSWVEDAVLAVKGGQLRGISPGFNVPAKGAERLVPEAGAGDSLVREITDSVVYEFSLVSRPQLQRNRIRRARLTRFRSHRSGGPSGGCDVVTPNCNGVGWNPTQH